jgi:hypothetical protein
MKDTGSIVSVYTALLSSLAYGGVAVPVYEDDPVETVPDNYVQIIQVSDSPAERNNTRWIREVTVQLDVITRQYKVSNRTVRDSIANDILGLITASIGVNIVGADFQITNIELDNSTYLNELDGAYHINRKILSIRNHLIQI